MSTPELEQRLRAAARHYSFPPTPELARAARARLPERRPRSRARIAVAVAVVLAALAAVTLAASPGARSALRDLFDRVPGVHIEQRESLPAVPYTETPYYGVEVGLDEAERRFGRPLLLPRGFGDPDAVYSLVDLPGDMITAVYGGDDERAELVFSQWKTSGRDQFYKVLTFNSAAEPAEVAGAPGLWIHGADHGVWYAPPDDDARIYRMEGYLAGNVLVWRVGDLLYRLEADVTRERALELAGSLR
jgi:hypothetical protein